MIETADSGAAVNLDRQVATWLVDTVGQLPTPAGHVAGTNPGVVLLLVEGPGPAGVKLPKRLPSNYLVLCLSFVLTALSRGFGAQLQACGVGAVEVFSAHLPAENTQMVNTTEASHRSALLAQWRALTGLPVAVFSPAKAAQIGAKVGAKVGVKVGRVPKSRVFTWTPGGLSRRDLFGLRRQSSLPLDFSPQAQNLTLQALNVLRSKGEFMPVAAGASAVLSPAKGLHLDAPGCTLCRVCERACPHGALEFTFIGGSPSKPELPFTALASHYRTNCQGCTQCVQLCPQNVLSATDLPYSQLLEAPSVRLASFDARYCGQCQAPYPAGQDRGDVLCEGCHWRAENPFGFRLPMPHLSENP